MSDPYTDQAKALAALSAENGALRAEIERLREENEMLRAQLDHLAISALVNDE